MAWRGNHSAGKQLPAIVLFCSTAPRPTRDSDSAGMNVILIQHPVVFILRRMGCINYNLMMMMMMII